MNTSINYFVVPFADSLRKCKMDQRKLNDSANTLVDMAKVWNCLVIFKLTYNKINQCIKWMKSGVVSFIYDCQ